MELEDKFLEWFFINTKFFERRDEILNFEQGGLDSSYDIWERFNLLPRRCLNHNIRSMKQMQNFTRGLKAQVRILLDASVEGTICWTCDFTHNTECALWVS